MRPFGACAAVACLMCLFVPCVPAAGTAQADHANQQKAEMVCNMAKFVQWPEAIVAQNRGQLVVTILGEDDLAAALASVLSSRLVNGKPVYVRFARRARDAHGSQIVYIAASESSHVTTILSELAGTSSLTLCDQPGFAEEGGTMNFSGGPTRMRFDVALQRAERSGLRISSRLLAISNIVGAGR